MDVAHLISALLPLLESARDNADAILELLGTGRRLADYEVARFVVAKRTEALVAELRASACPAERRSAVRWVELTWARGPAARVLREATKDRSKLVRQAAFRATRALRFDDVALPDTRSLRRDAQPATFERRGVNPFTREAIVFPARPARPATHTGFNPMGWRFGLYAPRRPATRTTPSFAKLRSAADVLALVGLSASEATALLRPGDGAAYVAFEVPKATGGTRTLHAPRPALKRAQRKILDELLAPLPAHPSAHGFVTGRSTVTNARPHVGAQLVLKTDLVDFFPTIHFGRLQGLFRQHGAGVEASRMLAALVTYRPLLPDGSVAWPSVLPQGAPTSPALSNLVCRRLDARLTALAARADAIYTRYADDLTFSFRAEPTKGIGRFAWWVNQIAHQEGFLENLKKRRVMRPSGQMRVTGLVTNESLSVPRAARRRFRAVLHDCGQRGVTTETTGHDDPRAYLLGFAAYLSMVDADKAAKVCAEVDRLLSVEAVPCR